MTEKTKTKKQKKQKIVKYRRPRNFNIGVVIFFIIIIYVMFNIFSYFTKTHIAEYQVQQGTIASNYVYQGIIVRDETVEQAKHTGYINYYIKNASKASVNDVVYSIDLLGTVYEDIIAAATIEDAISTPVLTGISGELDAFINDYNSNHFYECYTFFNNLNSSIAQSVNNHALIELSKEVAAAEESSTFYKVKAPVAGVISYEMDGLEGYSIEQILSMDLNYTTYKKTQLFHQEKVQASDPVYKRVNSENWNILIPIEETLATELNEKSSIKIRFCKDDFTTNASCSIMKQEDNYYLNLSLQKAMVRYINDRFIDVELVMSAKNGLKIPKSSITTKEFFTIPKKYFVEQEDTKKLGIWIQKINGNKTTEEFIIPTKYYETEQYYYIDSEDVSEGDIIVMENQANDTYRVGTDKAPLLGVYNINKGYAVFKQINIIYENEDYAVIETKTSYGIS